MGCGKRPNYTLIYNGYVRVELGYNVGMSLDNPIENPGYVYMVKCQGYYKVGLARDVKARLSSMQTGNPHKVELIYAVKTNYAKELEEALHEYLEEHWIRGEWFELTDGKMLDLFGRMLIFEKMRAGLKSS